MVTTEKCLFPVLYFLSLLPTCPSLRNTGASRTCATERTWGSRSLLVGYPTVQTELFCFPLSHVNLGLKLNLLTRT